MKRNMTITLEQDTALWLRVEAAKRDMSVSRFVGDVLDRFKDRTDGYDEAMEAFLARRPTSLGGGPYPERDELHTR